MMRVVTFTIVCFLIVFCTPTASAQGEIDDTDKIFYRNERTWALLLNTNGYGINYRRAKRHDGFRQRYLDVDFVVVKHPKETHVRSWDDNSRYVYGKLNYMYNARAGFGWQKEIYSKYDKGSIAIRRFYTIGATAAILKPIYYRVFYTLSNIKVERFEYANQRGGQIMGKEPFLVGLSETRFSPGAFTKFGYSFEYSKNDMLVKAIECGVILDAFWFSTPIMDAQSDISLLAGLSDNIYFSAFISYRFGKVVDKRTAKGESVIE